MSDPPMRVRPPAVAGSFYPADPHLLRDTVDRLIAGATPRPLEGSLRALIVPHAGYLYSGPVAASGYATLAGTSPPPRRIVLLGPSHFVPLSGLALPAAEELATPLGTVPVDPLAGWLPQQFGQVACSERAHRREHALEVQLPFLQRVLPQGFTVLPLAVGSARPAEVAAVIELLWNLPATLVVVSTDLSHYRPAHDARELDARTCALVVAGELEKLEPEMACGLHPLRGLMFAVRHNGLSTELLDLRNSSDTAGEPESVVGYGAFAVVAAGPKARAS